MGLIGIGVGTTHLGRRQIGADGQTESETKAKWEADPEGGSVAIWPMNPETMEPDGPALIFGDWDAANYLAKVVELIHPNRQINIPDLEGLARPPMSWQYIEIENGGNDHGQEQAPQC